MLERQAQEKALAEAEWLQVLVRDIMVGDVAARDEPSSLYPFAALTPQHFQCAQITSQSHIVDPKSLYEMLRRGSAGSHKTQGAPSRWRSWPTLWPRLVGASIRWVPHPQITQSDPNRALEHLI